MVECYEVPDLAHDILVIDYFSCIFRETSGSAHRKITRRKTFEGRNAQTEERADVDSRMQETL